MLTLGNVVRRLIAPILTAILFIGVTNPGVTYTVKDESSCQFNFTVISDVHMEGNNSASRKAFAKELYDIKNNTFGNDALVLLGDNTMNGQSFENMLFYGILDDIDPADRVLVALGNHDIGNGQGKYDKLIKRFYNYYNTFYNEDVHSPYYYKVVNGYYMIFMGSEADDSNTPVINDAQLKWLSDTLALAAKEAPGKPIFVFNHHTIEHSTGEVRNSMYSILTSVPNVIYLSGHTHAPDITMQHLTRNGNTYYAFNLPRVTELNSDDQTFDGTGQGINIEVYPDHVLLRERNFFFSEWDKEYTIELK